MALTETFNRRFAELDDHFTAMPYHQYLHGDGRFVPNGFWRKWATSADNLIRAVCGENSSHYRSFTAQFAKTSETEKSVKELYAIFAAAKDDFDGGYVFDVDLRVSGEVFGDFVALARQALSDGRKDVAAVLASAALEDALKRFAVANRLDVEGKDMQNVVNALKGASLVAGAQKSLLDAMPKLRNAAFHAEWGKLGEADVGSIIGFVEQFLLSKFSAP
ncbi:DUF4145 domain-containing protein [Paraburkholderia sp. MM5477-R1]|uniref:DUF4145 domain-containing protein n=1 Tax=Paraburkholderia sp. MM5477-R1 TaxID=2991062 RepID=UPI003D1F277A